MVRRYAVAFVVASGVTFGLFYLMQSLISMGVAQAERAFAGQVVEFVRLKRESELELKERRLPEKAPPEQEPPPPDLDLARPLRPDQNLESMAVDIGHVVDIHSGRRFRARGERSGHRSDRAGQSRSIRLVPLIGESKAGSRSPSRSARPGR